jgi:uncharacterized protein (TIGR02217 family)
MAFSETRLPARLAFGSTGGVERRTDVVQLASGFEQRSTPWADGRRRYLIGGGVRAIEEAQALVAFFEAQRGRLYGFRFQDFADFSSTPLGAAPGAGVTALDQPIATGDGATRVFQLAKAYGAGAAAYVRPIKKPVAETAQIAVAGVALATSAFAIDTTTGLVTLSSAPAAGQAITAGFQFDVPVRFDADRIDMTLESFEAARLVAIPLIEIRV